MSAIYMDVDAAVTVPVNVCPLRDDTDFKTLETAVAYNAAGMSLIWHFVSTAGVVTSTAVTPTTAGVYDWSHVAGAMYKCEIPASGGASANNDTEGYGYFTGSATGVLPWRGPTICFRAAALNNLLIDDAFSTTRGLAGTALPNAAAESSGGLPTLSAAQASNGTINANVHRWLTGTPNALQSGRVDSRPGAIANGILVAATFASDFWTTILSTLGLASGNLDTQLSGIATSSGSAASSAATAATQATTAATQATAGATSAATAATQSTNAASSAASADGKATAIQAKTDLIPASPAAVGSAMTLADGAITGPKFDASTAFPLTSVDTGATRVFRTGADGDTGETLSDEIAAIEGGGGGGTALTGPYVLTVTVTDADTAAEIEQALVRVWLNSDTESKRTNGDGEAIYAIGDAEAWNIAIDRYGYESYVGTFEVDGDHVDLPIELTANPSLPVSPVGSLTLYAEVKKVNAAGDGLEPSGAGVPIRLQVTNGPDGVAAPGTVLVATTGSDSIAAFTGIPYGARYEVWHGTATTKKRKGIAPTSGTDDTIPFVVGSA